MIAIIDYGAGNLKSVERAVTYLGYQGRITSNAETILAADKVILPGVGAARATMQNLNEVGLDAVLRQVYQDDTPLLGICIGIQILFGNFARVECSKDFNLCNIAIVVEMLAAMIAREVQHG